ncbi:Orotate phosphoribosyltransferase [compost metagenome]
MLLKDVYTSAKVVKSGNHFTTVNEFTDQLPALRPKVLWEAALEVVKAGNFNVDKIVTEEDKGTPLATLVSVMTNTPLAIARWYPYSLGTHNEVKVKIESEYFRGDLYLNGVLPGDTVAIIDDTISTGGALIALIKAIREAGGTVGEVVCVVEKVDNRGVERVLKETGITVKTIMKISVAEAGVQVLVNE